jgi:transposase-like protein
VADELDDDDRTMPSARAPRAREDADAGVRDCLDLMTSGRGVTGKSHLEVATRHGVHPDTVKKWSTNASRIIRFAIEGDVEDIRARMISTLDHIVATAMVTKKVATTGEGRDKVAEFYDAPDLRAAVAAIETQARLLGLVVQKHEVTMTEDEARKILADAKRLITAGDV